MCTARPSLAKLLLPSTLPAKQLVIGSLIFSNVIANKNPSLGIVISPSWSGFTFSANWPYSGILAQERLIVTSAPGGILFHFLKSYPTRKSRADGERLPVGGFGSMIKWPRSSARLMSRSDNIMCLPYPRTTSELGTITLCPFSMLACGSTTAENSFPTFVQYALRVPRVLFPDSEETTFFDTITVIVPTLLSEPIA